MALAPKVEWQPRSLAVHLQHSLVTCGWEYQVAKQHCPGLGIELSGSQLYPGAVDGVHTTLGGVTVLGLGMRAESGIFRACTHSTGS